MWGIRYLKAPSTTYVLQYKSGRIKRQGPGLSFFYFAPTSVIVEIPISSVDVPFAFTEVSADFQDVIVQGNLIYRIVEPTQIADLLDYSVNVHGRYQSEDPSKLAERLVQTAQAGARQFIQAQPLRNVLVASQELVEAVTTALHGAAKLSQLGVELLEVAVTSIKADPEMSKALQTEAREQLLKEADQAIYARRNSAVELERTIRENELRTERVVAERQREVRETEMSAEIAIEQQRSALVETRVENERREAESRGDALRAILEPVRDLDWRTLLAMHGSADSSTLISSAFDQLAQNAEKIGQLNISPELLESLTRSSRNG
ncbi:MAG: SPFH domain-containing protein [Planctomycetaceae bacterium]|nr:SPFH domain-containing protein [Planctomycetaceae bacterium]